VTLVGGFLGAGKTTLVNRLISSGERRYGVVVNEFGDVNVDSALIQELEDVGIAELEGGCVCCVGRADLTAALYGLLTLKEPLDYVLIELSGLADPVPVAQELLTTDWRGLLKLDGIVAVADARNLKKTLDENPEGRAQLAYASVVVLNKTDLVGAEDLGLARRLVEETNPLAQVVETSHAAIEPGDITDLDAFEPGWKARGHRHEHGDGIATLTLRSERPLQLGRWIMFHQHMMLRFPEQVLRAKGILEFQELDYPMVLQAVRELYRFDAYEGEHGRGSEVIIIGKDLDEDEYRAAFERVIVPEREGRLFR
jgi:G3E family GTPase